MTSFDRQFLSMLAEEKIDNEYRKRYLTPARRLSDIELAEVVDDARAWIQQEAEYGWRIEDDLLKYDGVSPEAEKQYAEHVKRLADRAREIIEEIHSRPNLYIESEGELGLMAGPEGRSDGDDKKWTLVNIETKRNSKMRRRRRNPRYSQEDKDYFRDYIKTEIMNAYGADVDEEKLDDSIENELAWNIKRDKYITDRDALRWAVEDVLAYGDIFYKTGPRGMSRRPVRDRSDRNPRLRGRNTPLEDLSYKQLIRLLEKHEDLEEKIEEELERRDVRESDSRSDIIQAYEDEDAFEAELSRAIDYSGPMQNPRRIRRNPESRNFPGFDYWGYARSLGTEDL